MRGGSCDVEHCDETQPLVAGIKGNAAYLLQEGQSKTLNGVKALDDDLADSESSPYLQPGQGGHYPCLDVVRILCVFLCVVDHGGTKFGVWNTMYVQSWVLQYLFYVCGFCFAMSSRGLLQYCSRLGLYFAIGVCVNFSAWRLAGRDPRSNIFGAVFQFWFIFGLIMFLLALAPVKSHLKNVREQARSRLLSAAEAPNDFLELLQELAKGVMVITAGCSAIYLVYRVLMIPLMVDLFAGPLQPVIAHFGESSQFWGMPSGSDRSEWAAFVSELLGYSELNLSNLFIVMVFPLWSKRLSLTLWIVLFNVYLHKCFLYRSQTCRMLNAFDSTLMGLTFYYLGFAGRRVIGEYLCRYWFLFLFACSLLWKPGMFGRLDESPPTELSVRVGYNLLEFWFALLFFTAIERIVDERIFSKDKLQFLGTWSLLIFLVHKFLVILATDAEYWFILAALIPVSKALTGSAKSKDVPEARCSTAASSV